MAIRHFSIVRFEDGFSLYADERLVLAHSAKSPLFAMGFGVARIAMHHGNFDIEDEIRELCPLGRWEILGEDRIRVWSEGGRWAVELQPFIRKGRLVVALVCTCVQGNGKNDTGGMEEIDRTDCADEPKTTSDAIGPDKSLGSSATALRVRISLPSSPNEHIYGCGEQFSYFDLKGRKFPLWTSEQGVGRNKSSLITLHADAADHAGGDYWWTFYPQPSFVSSQGYWVHMQTSAYSVFDFRNPQVSEFLCWDLPAAIVFGQAESMPEVLEDLTAYFGRQPLLPSWVYNGVILGIQGGTAVCEEKLRRAQHAGSR